MTIDLAFSELIKLKAVAEHRIENLNRYLSTWASPSADSDLNELYTNELMTYESIYTTLKEAVEKY
jgi:hypothetical protein